MGSIFRLNQLNNVVLSSILIAFPLAILTPPTVYGQTNLGLKDVNFGIRMQKFIDKAWKYYNKKDSDSLLDVILDIKGEVEAYTGNKINIEKEIDKIESDLKKKGGKAPKGVFKKFKDLVKKKDKIKYTRTLCMEAYFLDAPNITFEEYEVLQLSTTREQKDSKEQKQQQELPLKFVVAVSLILGGAFVMLATPICPILGCAGETMIGTGFGILLDQGMDIYQQKY